MTLAACHTVAPVAIDGIVWQPDASTSRPSGNWQDIGAKTLLIQWVVVDGSTLLPDGSWKRIAPETDWDRIAAEPWAQQTIIGLAGRFQESEARSQVEDLARESRLIPALVPTSVNIAGWYFPVEADPSWHEVSRLGEALDGLPRPLWISVYDKTNMGSYEFVQWLGTWLPDDVGILFQDGVGEHVRDARTARLYAQGLEAAFGRERVIVIAEAFRPDGSGRFRAATSQELRAQLRHYERHRVFLFDGPHYVDPGVVAEMSTERTDRVRIR